MTRIFPAVLAFTLPGLALAQGEVPFDMPAELAEARQHWLNGQYDIWDTVLPPAEAGHPVALNIAGVSYGEKDGGQGLPYDPAKSLDYLTRAAEAGSVRATYNLAIFWGEAHDGYGPDPDRKRALAEEAIAQGYIHADNLIGDLYFHGHGVEQSHEQALLHYRRAADKGSFIGLRQVGYAYYHGQGVPEDVRLSAHYLQRAIEAGDKAGIPNLAWLYEGNDGIEQDLLKSYLLYMRGIGMGDARSHYELGLFMAYDGYAGFWHDPVKGLGYCLCGVEMGYDTTDGTAAADCAELARSLSPEDRAKADAFAASLR